MLILMIAQYRPIISANRYIIDLGVSETNKVTKTETNTLYFYFSVILIPVV